MSPAVKRDARLEPGQSGNPISWFVGTKLADLMELPQVTNEDMELAFGAEPGRMLRSWGADEKGIHWLATQAGTVLHTDPAYARYSHHLIIRNDGYRIRGVDDSNQPPPMLPGTMYCLDTHSPHEVVDDPRFLSMHMPKPRYKVQLVLDADRVVPPKEVYDLFVAALADGRHPRDSAAEAPGRAPPSTKVAL